jgi:hypothetical protein
MSPSGDPAADPELDAPTRAVSHWVRMRRAQDIDLSDANQRRFGDYELVERLGVGGMGAVYRARQLSLEREVALKLIGVDAAFGEELISAFRSEARHAGRLQHPNIVPVFEIGSLDHLYYFSMGLVRGPTLQDWSRAQMALDSKSVARLLRSVAEAIEYAHGVGVLHLDLKPGNVLLDERGQPQVSDFGLAQRVGSEARAQAVGTPGYMAPEQAEDGRALSPATDVWGLGAILYRLLCGRAPVSADGARVLDWTVAPPRSLRPDLPADLVAVCMRCLQPVPEQRYPSARALADDLQRFIDGRPVGVRRQGAIERLRGWSRREPRSAALSAGLVLALVLGLAASTRLWWIAEGNRAQAQSTLWQARRAALIDDAARGDPLLAVPALVDNIAEAEAAGREDAAEADRLRFGVLMRQAPRVLSVWPQGDEGRALAFGEGGALLLAGLRGGELRALHTEDGSERWRTTPPFPPTPWGPSYVGRILPTPDGAHALLYASGSSGVVRPDTSAMQRVELASGRLQPVPATFERFEAASYSVDGDRALLRSSDDRMQLWRVQPWRPLGPLMAARGARYCLPLAQRSEVACVRSGLTAVELLDAGSGATLRTLTFEDDSELLSWHSDVAGRWLALGSSSGALRLLDLARDELHRFDEIGEGAAVDLGFAGPRLSVAYADGSLRVLDLEGLRWASPRLRAGGQGLSAARLDPEGRWMLANDGRIALWSLSEVQGQLQPRALQLLRHTGPVIGFQAFALDAGRGLIASHGNDGEIKLSRLPQLHSGLAPGSLQPGEASAAAAEDGLADTALAALAVSAPETSAYRLEYAARGRRAVLAAGTSLWVAGDAPGPRLRELALPASAQFLLTAADAERALVGWIEPEGLLRLRWRLLDTVDARWLGEGFSTEGAPAGIRLSASGAHLLLWQRDRLQRIGTTGSARVTEMRLGGEAGLRIVDADFQSDPAEAHVVLATQGRSVVQPATLERWQLRSDAWVQTEHIDTPFAHVRVLHGPHGLLGHGPRPALYAQGQRIELANLGSEFSEHAALAPDGRFAALGSRRGLLLLDLVERQPLLPETALPLEADDALAGLAFSADGSALELRSHYGRRLRMDMRPDPRAVPELRLEATDLSPAVTAEGVEPLDAAALRRQRDPGPPHAGVSAQAAAPIRGLTAANVPVGQRFQGSRGGLGITDSAAWPQGRLRLRDGDYGLAGAIQLVPEGQALGAARFPSVSPVFAVASGTQHGLELLITQQGTVAGEIDGEWLDAQGRVIARTRLSVPPAADPSGAAPPAAPVALLLRSAESRQRGGGSAQLQVYALPLARPEDAQAAEGFRLRAIDAAPLLLGLRELESN